MWTSHNRMSESSEETERGAVAFGATEDLLRTCDLVMVRDEMLLVHQRLNDEAEPSGGTLFLKQEYLGPWIAFRDHPDIETARAFLMAVPPAANYFRMCSPGGTLHTVNSMIQLLRMSEVELSEDDGLCIRGRIHLEWMFENAPDLLRKLHRTGTLQRYLYETLQQALERTMQLKDELRLSEDEAFEIATAEILAPANGLAFSENPPEPVGYQEQQVIFKGLKLL